MKKVILLSTDWEKGYWESSKEAPYTKKQYIELPEWNVLRGNLPLPGLGLYGHFKKQNLSEEPFVYLQVNGMRYDDSKQPYFSFNSIAKSKTKSIRLTERLSPGLRGFFSAIDVEELVKILSKIEETPPSDWMEMFEIKAMSVSWDDYLGKYFLEIEEGTLSNDEFEDRVAVLLNALGFKVNQKGHKIPGEYPDGIFSFDDHAIVYDCKNTRNFTPRADNERAIRKYLNDEKKIRSESNILCAFVAKSFRGESGKDIFYLPIDALLYLLYKKISFGSKFTLSPMKKVFDNSIPLGKEIIDKEWIK
ncbi:MAG TPA: hypothetical protein VMX17_09420 [Candidatus Glassbacteria bacterium]|nr:hypothetical protein [Candidatus Glassbacteria bacterium]